MPRPRCCVRRATPPPHTAIVHELSQRDTDAFIFGERCADLPRRRTSRAHSLPPNSRRATPPICPDLIYDRHNGCCVLVSARQACSLDSIGCTARHQACSPCFYCPRCPLQRPCDFCSANFLLGQTL